MINLTTPSQRRTDPLVVRLVQPLITYRMMFPAVYPIDTVIREHQEAAIMHAGQLRNRRNRCTRMHLQEYREDEVRPPVGLDIIIQPGIAHDFALEPGQGQEGHPGKTAQALLNLELDLVFEEARVFHHVVVKYELIREVGEDKIEEVDAEQR